MEASETADELQAAEALNTYVESLLADRAGELPDGLTREELQAYLLATRLAGGCPEAETPPAEVLVRLEARLRQSLAQQRRDERGARARQVLLSRRQGLAAAASLAAGVLVGVAVDRAVADLSKPHKDLVGANGRWYDVADVAALPTGAVRRFTAGAVDGYLINDGGAVRAYSAICTHMGCHLDWHGPHSRFECLCHGAAYSSTGAVVAGLPSSPLPAIHVRVSGGRLYAWGTHAPTWG